MFFIPRGVELFLTHVTHAVYIFIARNVFIRTALSLSLVDVNRRLMKLFGGEESRCRRETATSFCFSFSRETEREKMSKTPSLLLTKNKDEGEDDDDLEEEEEKKNKAIVDKEERTRSAKAKLSLSIVSVILLWFGSLSVCETVAKYSTTLTSLKATDDISSSFDRVAFAWERLAREAHEQKVRHERCEERTYRGCEKTLAREIEREEERARTARRENEDAVDRLANATGEAEREMEMLAATLRSQKLFYAQNKFDDDNTINVDKVYVDAVNAVLNARMCVPSSLTEEGNFGAHDTTLGNVIKRRLGINEEETEQLASDLESANGRYATSAELSVKNVLHVLEERREYDQSYMANKTEDFAQTIRFVMPELTAVSMGSIDVYMNASFANISNMTDSFASKASASMEETSQLLLETTSAANDMYREVAASTMSKMDVIKAVYDEEMDEIGEFFKWYDSTVQPFLEEAKLLLNPGIDLELFETTPSFGSVQLNDITFSSIELQGLNERTKQMMDKARMDAELLVSNFFAQSSSMVSKTSKELAEQVNATFISTTGNLAERFRNVSAFDDYNPPLLSDGGNNSKALDEYIQSELQLSETRKSAFDRDTAALSKRLDEQNLATSSSKVNFTSASERMTNTSRFEELVSSAEHDNTDLNFNIFAPLGFKAPGATLRNAFQNLKRAKDAVVHADVAYRVIRTVQVLAQHWHSDAFILEPMLVASSAQKRKVTDSSCLVVEDGRRRDFSEYGKAERYKRGDNDTKKVSTLERVAAFFGDPVHAAIVKFAVVFFVATIVWSAYYPILQSHSQKCSRKTFSDDILNSNESEDFQSTSSFLARNAYNSARDYIHVTPNATGEFQRKQLVSMKASAIRTHAATARSEFEALLAEADVIETSYRLVSMKDKKAFDACAPEHAILRELDKNTTSSSSSSSDFAYYQNQEILARSALNETLESIETFFDDTNSSYFITDESIYIDSARVQAPCLSNTNAAYCSGVRETPLRFRSKLAACETETFLHQTFSSVFFSLFIFFSVNATRKPFVNALGKIFWRANYVAKRDALRGTFRLNAKTATFSKEYDRYERDNQQILREQIRAHTTQQERKGYTFAILCVIAQLPWIVVLALSREMTF